MSTNRTVSYCVLGNHVCVLLYLYIIYIILYVFILSIYGICWLFLALVHNKRTFSVMGYLKN